MCGRAYETYTDEELAIRYLNRRSRKGSPILDRPNYNLAPTQLSPIVRETPEGRTIEALRWGLVPAWEPEFKTKLSTINAKSETVFTSKLYQSSVRKRRCIVPFSGFYEWRTREGEAKRPFAIRLKSQAIMSVAGIWSAWREGTPDEQLSFSVLTMPANHFMSEVHNRMPVILRTPEAEAAWLDLAEGDEARIARLIQPVPEDALEKFEVSTLVNSPRNNSPEVLKAIG